MATSLGRLGVNMKKILFTLFALCMVGSLCAQPQKSRVQNNNRRTTTSTDANSRAALMFPTAVDVPDDPVWRRDIYRELDLSIDENAALYYPTQPEGNDMNLFTLLFKLFSTGKIPAYKHDINSGKENFAASNRMHFKEFCENFNIYYEVDGNSIKVDNSDIPSAEVKKFYVKESSYYDQNTATYHSRIVALCPLIDQSLDFSFGSSTSPMFWVKYDDVKTYLSNHMVMTSNVNNNAKMSMEDFFSTNHYKGNIYMTNNMQGKSLAQVVADDVAQPQKTVDPTMAKAQKKIEQEMVDFEKHIWTQPVDSAELAKKDSIAAAQAEMKGRRSRRASANGTASKSSARSARRSGGDSSATKPKKEKSSGGSSSSSGSSAPRVSVRRTRH